MRHKLYVKIGEQYEELSAVGIFPTLKTVKKISVRDAVEKYIRDCTSRKCQENQVSEKTYFNKFCDFLDEKKIEFVDEITLEHMEGIESRFLKTMKYSSCRRRFAVFAHFFMKCIDWEYIFQSPLLKLKKGRVEKNHFKVWSQDNFIKFLDQTSGVWKALFSFLWLTGCRPKEAVTLHWTDVDFDQRIMILRCGKNANISREFPLTDEIIDLLHSIGMNGNLVFSIDKRPISSDNIYQYAKHRLKILGLTKLTVYGLRHSFASRLSDAGVNAFQVKDLMGHSDIKTTLNYVHSEKNQLIDSLKRVMK